MLVRIPLHCKRTYTAYPPFYIRFSVSVALPSRLPHCPLSPPFHWPIIAVHIVAHAACAFWLACFCSTECLHAEPTIPWKEVRLLDVAHVACVSAATARLSQTLPFSA